MSIASSTLSGPPGLSALHHHGAGPVLAAGNRRKVAADHTVELRSRTGSPKRHGLPARVRRAAAPLCCILVGQANGGGPTPSMASVRTCTWSVSQEVVCMCVHVYAFLGELAPEREASVRTYVTPRLRQSEGGLRCTAVKQTHDLWLHCYPCKAVQSVRVGTIPHVPRKSPTGNLIF